MSHAVPPPAPESSAAPPPAAEPAPSRPRLVKRVWRLAEDAVVVLTLGAMVVLPLLEALFRKLRWSGVSAAPQFVQHGSLILGLIGGAVAAREDRLLSMATGELLGKGWLRAGAKVLSGAISAAVTAALCAASIRFVQQEKASGAVLAYGVEPWMLQLAMPIGFGMIALRIVWHSSRHWSGRAVTAALTAGLLGFCVLTHPEFAPWANQNLPSWLARLAGQVPAVEPQTLVSYALYVLLAGTLLGGPIFVMLGGAAAILFWADLSPLASIPIDHYRLVTNPSLPALALFTLVGYVLAAGGASKRLVRVFEALFGSTRGGPAVVTVLVCAFFTSFTGASGVTILALGGLLMPVLVSAGYSERRSLGLLTGAGSLGMLFPPCLPLILYGIIAKVDIKTFFLAALLPGLVLVILTAALGWWMGPPRRRHERPPFRAGEAAAAIWQAKWELFLPMLCLGLIYMGWMTIVEASAMTALYAILTQTIIWRDLRIFRDLPRVVVETGLVIGGVLLILGLAQAFTNYILYKEIALSDDVFTTIPEYAVDWVTSVVQSPLMFLLLLNGFLLVVGCLMDVYSAIVVVVPLLLPIAAKYHIDPLHLGVIFLSNLELGFLTPPVGMNLFLSSYRFGKPMSEVCRSILPILITQLAGVLLITYIPPLSLLLPAWFG